MALHVNCCTQRPSIRINFDHFRRSVSHVLKQAPIRLAVIQNVCMNSLDAFVSSVFEFMDQPLLLSQRNFAPVSELGEAVSVDNVEGTIPDDFPAGVYIRNGPNPLFGGLKSTKSIFGQSSHTWIEGEGMLHAVYFDKDSDGKWIVQYNNRYVETETYKLEKQRNRPSFLPAIEGDPPAILSAYLLNSSRFGNVHKLNSNTNVFEHGEKFYSIAENHMPQEIDVFTLETLGNWNVDGDWNRSFTSHPKRAPGTGELVIIGVDAVKPFMELGIISADGKKLLHKADVKLDRCSLCHEIGVTQRYNVIMDFPLTIDINRLVRGGPLIRFNKKEYARIGIMPRYGDGNSIQWFDVKTSCVFHILNCFEDGDEVILWACRAPESIIPGPDFGLDKFQWFSKRLKPIRSSQENGAPTIKEEEEEGSLFSRAYEWRLNMNTGEAKERNLTGTEYSMEFPMINNNFTGLKNKYGYTQVVDSSASSISGMPKYGGLAKLYLDQPRAGMSLKDNRFEDAIMLDHHEFGDNVFCTGAAFVPKENGFGEDDGWIITFVHNVSHPKLKMKGYDTAALIKGRSPKQPD